MRPADPGRDSNKGLEQEANPGRLGLHHLQGRFVNQKQGRLSASSPHCRAVQLRSGIGPVSLNDNKDNSDDDDSNVTQRSHSASASSAASFGPGR